MRIKILFWFAVRAKFHPLLQHLFQQMFVVSFEIISVSFFVVGRLSELFRCDQWFL